MKNTLIIAEADVNHNGSIKIAKQLIDATAEAQVDFEKFQTFKTDKIVTRSSKRASYQDANIKNTDSQFKWLQNNFKLILDATVYKRELEQVLIKTDNRYLIKFLYYDRLRFNFN